MKKLITSCLLLMLAVPLTAQQTDNTQRRLLKKAKSSREYAALGQKSLDEGHIDEAKQYWRQAKREKQISIEEICLGGDIYLKEKNIDMAEKQYRRAIYFDTHNETGYNRLIALYTDLKQTQKAAGVLDTLGLMRPDLDVKSRIANLYYQAGDNANTLKAYSQMDTERLNLTQLRQYASAELVEKNYSHALQLAERGHRLTPRNAVFNRLRMAANTEMKLYDNAIKAANDYFNHSDSLNIQPFDYIWYAKSLNGVGRTNEAIIQFDNALQLSKDNPDIVLEIARTYLSIRQYEPAAKYYARYVKIVNDENNRYYYTYQQGRIYWLEAIDDSINISQQQRMEALHKADSYFKQLTELQPENYQGYYWRARANSVLDENTKRGLAKPYYEKVIELLSGSDEHKETLTEAYKWLAYYYYENKNHQRAHLYAAEALRLAPTDDYARRLYDATEY